VADASTAAQSVSAASMVTAIATAAAHYVNPTTGSSVAVPIPSESDVSSITIAIVPTATPTQPPSASSPDVVVPPSEGGDGASMGMILGIICGLFLVLALLGLWCYRSRTAPDEAPSEGKSEKHATQEVEMKEMKDTCSSDDGEDWGENFGEDCGEAGTLANTTTSTTTTTTTTTSTTTTTATTGIQMSNVSIGTSSVVEGLPPKSPLDIAEEDAAAGPQNPFLDGVLNAAEDNGAGGLQGLDEVLNEAAAAPSSDAGSPKHATQTRPRKGSVTVVDIQVEVPATCSEAVDVQVEMPATEAGRLPSDKDGKGWGEADVSEEEREEERRKKEATLTEAAQTALQQDEAYTAAAVAVIVDSDPRPQGIRTRIVAGIGYMAAEKDNDTPADEGGRWA